MLIRRPRLPLIKFSTLATKSVLFLFLCNISLLPASTRREESRLCYDPSIFQTGDIIFRKGRGLLSQIVLSADDQSPFSHVGLVKRIDGNLFVVHAIVGEPLGGEDIVKVEPLEIFLGADRASAAALYRLKDDSHQFGEKAADIALSYAAKRIPFDSDFDLKTADKLYCTELVWRAYKEAGLDLVDGEFDILALPLSKGPYLLPRTLLKSRWLQSVSILDSEK